MFTDEQEVALKGYVLRASDIYFGVTPKEVRKIVVDFAVKLNVRFPIAWRSSEMAGEDWFTAFMKRHPRLSIRRPQATSLARCIGFNRETVAAFFCLLKSVLDKNKFQAHQIWNMDETGMSTTHHPRKIVSRRGFK